MVIIKQEDLMGYQWNVMGYIYIYIILDYLYIYNYTYIYIYHQLQSKIR